MSGYDLHFNDAVPSESGVFYSVLQFLGKGGNSVTHLVIANSGVYQGLLFALKVFTKLDKPDRHQSFLDEIAFLQDCNHPSIMRVFDRGVLRGAYPFVVAEYLPTTLELHRGRISTTIEKISVTVQLLSALQYLANRIPQVVHRDIKPNNIFLKGPTCVLGDFGLMKQINDRTDDDRETLKESLGVGMPRNYRTPDLVAYLNGESALTVKSDIFQLGLVVAELFTGVNPCKRSRSFEEPVQLEPVRVDCGEQSEMVQNIVSHMLEIDCSQRDSIETLVDSWQGLFRSAAQMAHASNGKVFPTA